MNDPAIFTWLPFLGFGWIVLLIAVSIIFIKKRGKSLFPKAPFDALFSERGCSGRSLDTPWGRIGGARNCLLIALTSQKLIISPTFPFNLMFLAEIYGLGHDLDLTAIKEVIERKTMFGISIRITYADQKVRRVELRLRHHDDFLVMLRKLGVSVSVT